MQCETSLPQRETETETETDVRERNRRAGRLGGQATLARHGVAHLRACGEIGGAMTAMRGREYYVAIGRRGGTRGRGKPKRRREDRAAERVETARVATAVATESE